MIDERDYNPKLEAYKNYYKASRRSDEWAEVDKAKYREEIDRLNEADSYQGGA